MLNNNAPYIKKATLKGYKSIRDVVEIDLLPGMNIIVGPNGSGKSNFLEFLNDILIKKAASTEGSYYFNLVLISSLNEKIEWEQKTDGKYVKPAEYDTAERIIEKKLSVNEIEISQESIIDVRRQLLYITPKNKINQLLFPFKVDFSSPYNKNDPESKSKGLPLLERELSCEFENNEITNNSHVEGIFNKNFAEELKVLNNLTSVKREELIDTYFQIKRKLIEDLRNYSPISDLRIDENIKIYKKKITNIFLQFKIGSEWYSWDQLSDGTKRLFSIIHSVSSFERLILLEEPELGVHPHQLFKLMNFLKEQSEHKQIIITTHSPDVLNVLTSDELDRIIVTEMTAKGTKMRHLTEKQIKKAQKYMATELSLGDYWVYSDLEPQNTAL